MANFAIFLESIHLYLDFGGFYSVVAPKLEAVEFMKFGRECETVILVGIPTREYKRFLWFFVDFACFWGGESSSATGASKTCDT